MRSPAVVLAFVVALAPLSACGGADPAPTTDGGPLPRDAGDAGDAGDPTGDAGSGDAGGPACDVSPRPDPLGTFAGTFALATDDEGSSTVPVATGGDPTGLWVFETATFYVGRAAAEMFDEDASSVAGTAWIALDGEEMRLHYDFVTTLEGTLAGTIIRPTNTRIRGAYEIEDARVVVEPSCVDPPPMPVGGSAGLQFSIDGDHGTFISNVSGAAGAITIVFEGTRRAL